MTGKYDALHTRLLEIARRGESSVQLGFDELDALVGGLPVSARTYREWWANRSQPHCWAWREAGWIVAMVSQTAVRFERDRGAADPSGVRPGFAVPHPSGAAIDPNTFPVIRKTDARVVADWRDAGVVALDAGGEVVFPVLPPVAGLYEMTFTGARGQERPRVYVGETEDLRRRATHYRNPGPTQATNQRLNAAIRAQFAAGGAVRLAIATEVTVTMGGEGSAVSLDLTRKASRVLVESAVLVAARHAGAVDIENLE